MLYILGTQIPVSLGLVSEKRVHVCASMHTHRFEIKLIKIWDNKFYLISIFDLSTLLPHREFSFSRLTV